MLEHSSSESRYVRQFDACAEDTSNYIDLVVNYTDPSILDEAFYSGSYFEVSHFSVGS